MKQRICEWILSIWAKKLYRYGFGYVFPDCNAFRIEFCSELFERKNEADECLCPTLLDEGNGTIDLNIYLNNKSLDLSSTRSTWSCLVDSLEWSSLWSWLCLEFWLGVFHRRPTRVNRRWLLNYRRLLTMLIHPPPPANPHPNRQTYFRYQLVENACLVMNIPLILFIKMACLLLSKYFKIGRIMRSCNGSLPTMKARETDKDVSHKKVFNLENRWRSQQSVRMAYRSLIFT